MRGNSISSNETAAATVAAVAKAGDRQKLQSGVGPLLQAAWQCRGTAHNHSSLSHMLHPPSTACPNQTCQAITLENPPTRGQLRQA